MQKVSCGENEKRTKEKKRMNILKLRILLFDLLTPILKWTAKVHSPWTHKKVTGIDYYQIRRQIPPGTIFATRIKGDLTDWLVPGYYCHIGVYCPINEEESVVQAESPGVERIDLVSFLTTKDDVMVLIPNVPEEVMKRAAQIAATFIGAAYDFQYDWSPSGVKAFYCSEVAWVAYDQACKEFGLPSLFSPKAELGVPSVSPQDIVDNENFVKIYRAGGS